jgi:hypothetical protein
MSESFRQLAMLWDIETAFSDIANEHIKISGPTPRNDAAHPLHRT